MIAQAVGHQLFAVGPMFVPRAAHVGFVVEKVALEQVFLQVFVYIYFFSNT
jgi:hypothetical protein